MNWKDTCIFLLLEFIFIMGIKFIVLKRELKGKISIIEDCQRQIDQGFACKARLILFAGLSEDEMKSIDWKDYGPMVKKAAIFYKLKTKKNA